MRGRKLCFGLLCIKGGEAFVSTPGCLGRRTNHKCWASSSGPDSESSGSPAVDNVLLEAARQEVLATDAEWYRSVILGEEARQAAARGASPTPIREVDTAAEVGEPAESAWAGKLRDLGYTAEEIDLIPADVAEILVDSGIPRPAGGVPPEWTAGYQEAAPAGAGAASEEEEEEVEEEYVTRRAPRRREVYYEDEDEDDMGDEWEEEELLGQRGSAQGRGRRRGAPLARRGGFEDDDGFGPTFDEEEPGFFPLAVRSLSHAVQQVGLFRPLLREPRFKNLLSREADFRLAVAGPWLADLLRDEYRWRLSVYRDYLRLDDDDDDDRRSRRERVRGTSLDPWTWGDEEEETGDTEEGAQGVYEEDVFEDQDADDVVVVVNKRGDKMRAEKSFGRPVSEPPRRRPSRGEGRRRRRRDVEAWDGEEEENENERSSTWSWVNANARGRGRTNPVELEEEDEEEEW